MHQRPAPLPGHGLESWQTGPVAATSSEPATAVWRKRRDEARRQLAALAASDLGFDRLLLRQKLATVLESRDHAGEPVVLANRDISPENLLVREGAWVGLVDPVPVLDNGTYYAAWFSHCYRLLLSALSPAPRYAHHHHQASPHSSPPADSGSRQTGMWTILSISAGTAKRLSGLEP
jgi:hypothetical protein